MSKDLSLEQLEHDVWPTQKEYLSNLVRRCHEYRKIPVAQLTVEQIRLLIGQQIGIPFLLPRALSILESDLLAQGDFYAGDLLASVLALPETTWVEIPILRSRLKAMLLERLETFDSEGLSKELRRRIHALVSS